MKDAIQKLSTFLSQQKKEDSLVPNLEASEYEAIPFSKENFRPILRKAKTDTINSFAFIDGGQAELLASSEFSLSFIRTCAIEYSKELKRKIALNEFFLLILPKENEEEITYEAFLYPKRGNIFAKKEMLIFKSSDETLKSGIRNASPSSLISASRRFSELELAYSIGLRSSKQNEGNTLLVLDGTLQKNYSGEEELLLRLRSLPASSTLIGLSKTNSILTTTGESYSSSLLSLSPKGIGMWRYSPIAHPKKHLPHLSFARMHEKSDHAFLLESFSSLPDDIYSSLASLCRDPLFLGYPYGLIEADREARVSSLEAAYLKNKILAQLDLRSLSKSIQSKDAHSLLDSMSF